MRHVPMYPLFLGFVVILGLLSLSSFDALALSQGGPPSSNPGLSNLQNSNAVGHLSTLSGAPSALVVAPEPATVGLLLVLKFRRRHSMAQKAQ